MSTTPVALTVLSAVELPLGTKNHPPCSPKLTHCIQNNKRERIQALPFAFDSSLTTYQGIISGLSNRFNRFNRFIRFIRFDVIHSK